MTSKQSVVVGSRGSQLALWQSRWVSERLREAHPGIEIRIEVIQTTGDRILDRSIPELGGKAVFTKEIQDALLENRVDLAVHSLKDVPTWPVPGLVIHAHPQRVDPRDAWLAKNGLPFAELKDGDVVATGSLRRQAQIRNRFPGVVVEHLRGNVDTRLRKLQEGVMTGIVLAMAGLTRLGLTEHVTEAVGAEWMLPSPGQGALAIEGRDDEETRALLSPLDHAPTRRAVNAERALLRTLEGSCQVPIGAFAQDRNDRLVLEGMVADPDGTRLLRRTLEGDFSDADAVGVELGERLLADGGRAILDDLIAESGA